MPARTFEDWIDAHGYRDYVARCASGSLGMEAPAIVALRDTYERDQVASLVPDWWWQNRGTRFGFSL
jgi:hypothetical protein